MNPSDAIEAIEKPLSSLPYSLSRHILEHLRKLTSHEPVIGIMGKSGAGKSSLCNALFQGEVTPVSDVHAGTREVQRFRLSGHGHSMVITDLPGVGESRDRPLTREELMQVVPSVFGEEKHTSRSENYTWIPTITVLESLQREGFQPFFACQTRVRDPGRRGYTKHMLRLRRDGEINGQHVPEIILLNSHDGTSSYQMLPGYFRFVCQNGCVCGQSLGEVRVPHRGDVVEKVIEGAYEVVGVFDRIEEKRDAMQSLVLPPPARQALAQAALTYRYGDEHQPVTTADILTPRRREDYGKDLWSAYQTIQENMLKGGISGRSAKGKRIHTRAIHSIDTDIKLNRALWVMAETLLESMR